MPETEETDAAETVQGRAGGDAGPAEVVEGRLDGPEAYKPPPAELVPVSQEDVFRAMDRADEEQILDELQGRALGAMLYSFPGEGGEKLTDLSYAGVAEAVRTVNARGYGQIRVAPTPPLVEEISEDGEQHYRVTVYGEDQRTGGGQWGVATCPKRMQLKDKTARKWREKGRAVGEDNRVWDSFALTKALSKAQRNAMKPSLPQELVQTLIAQYLGDESKVARIAPGPAAEALAGMPAPLTDARAEAQKARCREVYDEIKGVAGRLWFKPGEFNAWLAQCEHSHDRLADLIEHLGRKLEEAQASKAAEANGS